MRVGACEWARLHKTTFVSRTTVTAAAAAAAVGPRPGVASVGVSVGVGVGAGAEATAASGSACELICLAPPSLPPEEEETMVASGLVAVTVSDDCEWERPAPTTDTLSALTRGRQKMALLSPRPAAYSTPSTTSTVAAVHPSRHTGDASAARCSS